jgi:PAS domain S-box-containing protein
LNESEIKLKKIIEQIRDGIIIFDKTGKIIIWNSGTETITGLKQEIALNSKITDIQFEILYGAYKNKELIDQKFEEIITFSTPDGFNKIFENEIFSDEKGVRVIQGIVFPIFFAPENYLFGSVIRDISEFKEIEKQLMDLSTTKDNFISILAHDLRSPFNSILGFSKLLLDNLWQYKYEDIEKKVRIIYESSLKSYNLMEEILLWAKSQTGKLAFDPQIIDFIEICSEISESFTEQAKSKEITINCFESDKTFLKADLNIIKTILRNLISNALKYCNPNGQINIFSVKKEKFAEITVADNGIGIDKESLTKLWGIKEHFSTPGTAKEEGSGFGLVLCKEFVEKSGGKIWAESEAGRGSNFIFTIPIAI